MPRNQKHNDFLKSRFAAGCSKPCGLEPAGCRMCPDKEELTSIYETCLDIQQPPLDFFGRCTANCNTCPAARRQWK